VAIRQRRLSVIARVDVTLGTQPASIYIKAHRNPGAPASRVHRKARLEYDTLCHLHERFGPVAGCAVVRPIAFFPEHLTVVTEAGAGANLHQLVKKSAVRWRSRAGLDAAGEHCRMAGVWLRHFQTITDQVCQAPLPRAQMVEWIEADVAQCVALGLPARDGAALVAFARARLAAVGDRPFPVVGQHPDYQPDNVLVSPGRATVLDFTSFQHGTPFSDVARFAAALDFLAKSPLYPRGRCRSLAAAFLDGYGGVADEHRPAVMISLIHHMARGARTVASWPRPALLRRAVERQTMRFLARWGRELCAAGDAFLDTIGARTPADRREPRAHREMVR
jgi:hypothetical protein